MIDNFIDSALIIDDNEGDIKDLLNLLNEKDIWAKHYLPEDLENIKTPLKNRKIIFLDLYVDDKQAEVAGQIAIIRKIFKQILGTNFGTYGIVLWSAHTNEMCELKSRIQKDSKEYTLPLFIVGLDKLKYLKEGFSNLFNDLNQELEENIAAKFFIKWNSLVSQGKDKAITNIYSLIEDYDKQNKNLKFILFQMARNYTGIPFENIGDYPLHIDAFKAFNDLMNYEITTNESAESDIFKEINDVTYVGKDTDTEKYEYAAKNHIHNKMSKQVIKKDGEVLNSSDKGNDGNKDNIEKLESEITKIYSNINSKILIDEKNIHQSSIFPGNVYEIKDAESDFIADNLPDDSPDGLTHILIEMTPPCDFSQKKMMANSRVLGGFMYKYSKDNVRSQKPDYFYKEIWPLDIEGRKEPQMIVFDFRYFGFIEEEKLKDPSRYNILFRAKDKLFADILQKLSSHTARLGLSIIN